MDKLFYQDFSKPPDLKTGTNIPQTLFNRSTGNSKNVPKELQYMAEEALIMKSHKEFPCKLPDVPRSTFLMVFSPDGTKVASTHGNHNVYVTELTSKRNVRTLSGHPRTPWCIAFHPSSNQILASGCLGGQVRVWDLHGGSEIWMTESQTVIASLAFHPTDRLLVIASYNEVLFWDWSCPAPFAKSTTINEKEKVRFVGFDPLGHKLLTGVANAPLRIESQWNRTPLPPAPSQPPPAPPDEPFQNDYERRIIVCYRFMVQQYEQLVHRYRLLIRARSGNSSSIAGSSSSVLGGGGDVPPLRRRTPPTPGSGARTIRRFRSNHPLPTRLTQFQLARLRPAVLRLSDRRVPGSLFSSRVNRGVVSNPVAASGGRESRSSGGGDSGGMLQQFESEITESLARLHRNIRRMRIHMPWESEHRDARASSAMNTPLNAMYTSDSDIDIETFGPAEAGGGSPPSPHSARITVVPNPSGAHSWRQRDPFSYTPGRNTSSLGERIRNRSHQSELRRLYLRANRFPVFGPRTSGRPHRNPGPLNRAAASLARNAGSLNRSSGSVNRTSESSSRSLGTLNRSPGSLSRLPGALTRTIDNRTPEQAAPAPPTDYESLQSLLSELNSDAARGYWATRQNGEVMGYQPPGPGDDERSTASGSSINRSSGSTNSINRLSNSINRSSGVFNLTSHSSATSHDGAPGSGLRNSAELSMAETGGDSVTLESMLANVGSASSTGGTGSLTLSESEVTLNPGAGQSEDPESSRSAVVSVMGVARRPYTSYPAGRLVDLADYLATTEDVLEPTGPFLRATTYSIRQFFGNMQATYNVIASGGVTSLSIERLDFLHEHYASNRSFQSIVQLARHLYHASIMCRARFLVVKAAHLDRRWTGILQQLTRYSAFAVTPANTSRTEATAEFFSDLDRNGRLLEVCFGALAEGASQEYDRNIFDAASEVRGYEDAARRLQRVLLRHLRWTSRRLDVWATPRLPQLGDVAELDGALRRELLALDVMTTELTQPAVRAVRDQFVDTLIQDLSPPIFEDTLITCIRRFSSLSSRMDDIITTELSSLPAMPPDPAAMPGPSRAGASAAMFSEDEFSGTEADVNPYDDLGDGASMTGVLGTVNARPGFDGVESVLGNVDRPGFEATDPVLDNTRPGFDGVESVLDPVNNRTGFDAVESVLDPVNNRTSFDDVDAVVDFDTMPPVGTSRTSRSVGHDIRGNRSVGDDNHVTGGINTPIGDNVRSNRSIEGSASVRDEIHNILTGEESADISYMEEILARSNRITRNVARDIEGTSSNTGQGSTRFNRTGDDATTSNSESNARNGSARSKRSEDGTSGGTGVASHRAGTARSGRATDDNRSGSTRHKRTFGEASGRGNGATDRADDRSGATRTSDETRSGASRTTRLPGLGGDSANPAHRKLLRRSRQQRLRPAYRVASSSSSEDEAPVIEISDTDSDRPSTSSSSDLLRRLKALAHTNGTESIPNSGAPPADPQAPPTSAAHTPLSSESSPSDSDSGGTPGHSSTSSLLRRLKALTRTPSSEATPDRRPVDPGAASTSTAQSPISSESSSFSNIMQSVREFITQLESLVGPGRNYSPGGRHATGRSSAAPGRSGRTRAADIFDIFPSSSSSSSPSSSSTSTPEAPSTPSAPATPLPSLLCSPLSAFMSGLRRKRKLPAQTSDATEPAPRRRRRHPEPEPSQQDHEETFSSTKADECSCWFRAAVDSSTPAATGSHQSPGTSQAATACPLDRTHQTSSCDSSTNQPQPGCSYSSSNQPKAGCSYSSSNQSRSGVDSLSNQPKPGGSGEPGINRYSYQSKPDGKQLDPSVGQPSNDTGDHSSVAHLATCAKQSTQLPSRSSQPSSSSAMPQPLSPPRSAPEPLDQEMTSSNEPGMTSSDPLDARTTPPAVVSEGIFTRFVTRFERLLETDRVPNQSSADSGREEPTTSENASPLVEEPPFGHSFPAFPSARTPTPPDAQAATAATQVPPLAPRSGSQAPHSVPHSWESVRFLRVPRARPWESCSFSSPNSRVPSPSRIVDVEMLRVPSLSPWEMPIRSSSNGGRDFATSVARSSRSTERGNNPSTGGGGYGRNIFTEEGGGQSNAGPGSRNTSGSTSGTPSGSNRDTAGPSTSGGGGGLYLLSRFLNPELAGGASSAEGTPTFSYLGRSRDRSRTRERDRDRSRSGEDRARHRYDRSPEDTEISRADTPSAADVPDTPSQVGGPSRGTTGAVRRERESDSSGSQLRTTIKSYRTGGHGSTTQTSNNGTQRFDTTQRNDATLSNTTLRAHGIARSGTNQRSDATQRDDRTGNNRRTDSNSISASNERSDNQREDTPQRTVQRLLHNPRVSSIDLQWPHERGVRFPSPDLNLSVSIAEASRLIDHSLVCLRNSASPRDASTSTPRAETNRHGFLARSSPLNRPLARSSPLNRPIPSRTNSSPLNLTRALPLNRPLSRCSPLNRPIPRSSPLNRPHSSPLNRPHRTGLLSRIHASGGFMSRAGLGRSHSPSRATDLPDAARDVGRSNYLMNQRRRMLVERRNALLRGNALSGTGNGAAFVTDRNGSNSIGDSNASLARGGNTDTSVNEGNTGTPQDASPNSSTRQGPFTPRDDAAESGTRQGAFTSQSRGDRTRQNVADSRTRARLVSLANLAKSRNSRRLYAMLRPEMGAGSSAAPERPPPPPPPASTLPSTSRGSRTSRRRSAHTSSSDPERSRMMKARSQARHILAMMLRHISSFFQNANLLDLPSQQDQQESFFFHERVYNLHRLLQLALHLTELLYAQLSLSRHLLDNLRSSLNSVTRLQSLLRHRQASSSLLHLPAFRPARGPIRLTRESSVPISVQSSQPSSDAPAPGLRGDLPQVHLNDTPLSASSSPPTLPPLPSSPPSYRGARFLHPRHHGGGQATPPTPWDEGEERGAAPGGGLGSNVFLMRGAYGPNSILVPDSYYSPHHRIQAWDFARSNIPDIWNAQKNIVVKECKIHNDASVDISKDGQILVTLLPSGRLSVTTMLGVYSLHWASLGQCLYTTSFELNAVSVALSPTSRHLIVGLASRRVSLSSFADTHTIAQIFRLEGGVAGPPSAGPSREGAESGAGGKEPPQGGRKGRLVQLRHIELPRDTGYMSLNCIRWAPTPGQGLVYGTNTGLLRILE